MLRDKPADEAKRAFFISKRSGASNTHFLLLSRCASRGGTLRFGHALRLLGQANHAHLMDALDELESVSSQEQLLHILQRAVQACTLASAKSSFILVPTDEDLPFLLDDVAQHGVRLIASLLLILSALRYPPATTPKGVSDQPPLVGTGDPVERAVVAEPLARDEGAVHHDA